jgi:hypothetical protein
MYQNEALYDICTTQLKNKSPSHKDLNALIAKVMSGFTSESGACDELAELTIQLLFDCVYSLNPMRRNGTDNQPRCPQLRLEEACCQHG